MSEHQDTWEHYDDLPYEIIVQHFDGSGVVKEYCEGRSSIIDEANRRAVNMGRAAVSKQVRFIVRNWKAGGQ